MLDYAALIAAVLSGAAWRAGSIGAKAIQRHIAAVNSVNERIDNLEAAITGLPCHRLTPNPPPGCPIPAGQPQPLSQPSTS